MIDSCTVVGFVNINNAQQNISPVTFNSENHAYYSPVKYPGLLTEHAASESSCSSMIKLLIITYGVVIFIVQFIQVCMYIITTSCITLNSIYRFILHMLLVLMLRDYPMVLVIIDYTINKLKSLKNPDTKCRLFINLIKENNNCT